MKKSALSFACMHVINGDRPVLYVWKQDGEVSFACGQRDHRTDTIEDWGMAHAFHFTDGDPAMGIVRVLEEGEQVMRQRVGGPWLRLRL
jgi:hypothetical protein